MACHRAAKEGDVYSQKALIRRNPKSDGHSCKTPAVGSIETRLFRLLNLETPSFGMTPPKV